MYKNRVIGLNRHLYNINNYQRLAPFLKIQNNVKNTNINIIPTYYDRLKNEIREEKKKEMTRADVDDVDKMDEYYNKNRKFKFQDGVEINSLEDIYNNLFVIVGLFTEQRNNLATYYKRGALHCEKGKYRSIDDFITISKNYFPEKDVKEIITFLKEQEEKYLKEDKIQNFGYCPNIRKYNYRGFTRAGTYFPKIDNYDFNDIFPKLKKKITEIVN